MGKRSRKVESQEVGLEIGAIVFRHFLRTEYLHYGLFTNGLTADVANLAEAQQNYADFLIAGVPAGVRSILDVGCGTGKLASELIARGYRVDCVSPGKTLTRRARELLGNSARIYESKFEHLNPDTRYDLVLFSESFQYIPMHRAFENALQSLNPGGYVMICDFFRTDAPGRSPLGGGHAFGEFEGVVKRFPLREMEGKDITGETAPTLDLVNSFSLEVMLPVYTLIFHFLEDRFPWFVRFVKWKYRKKLEKLERKHFRGERNAKSFARYKTYRFYLFQAEDSRAAAVH
jgi:SAM-dependent methyltransferase